jgi:pimeloyl-ACP methyl ester carboxylesterase
MKVKQVVLSFVFVSAMLSLGACQKESASVTPSTGTLLSADGVSVKYETAGRGELALVFVHCWTCNRGFWDEQFSHFAKQYRVVRLDLAGHGESAQGRKVYSIASFGADVAAVVNQLGLKKVVLIGHSMGAPVSAEAQKVLGDRVIGVVGVDSFYTGFQMPPADKLAEFFKPFEDNFVPAQDQFVRSMFTPSSDKALIERITKAMANTPKEVGVSAIKETFQWYGTEAAVAFQRMGKKLRNINADPKGEGKPLHESVVLIAGAGHFVAQEKPAEFNQALERIIGEFSKTAH